MRSSKFFVFGWMLMFTLMLTGCVNVQDMERDKSIDDAVNAHVKAAAEYLVHDQPNEAKRHLSEAIQLRPKSAMVQNGLALLYRYLHDQENEEKYLKLAIRYDGKYAAARTNYGVLLASEKRYKEAIKQFQVAATDLDNPSSGLAWANMGRCYERMGEDDKALVVYRKAALLSSTSTDVYLNMANIYLKRKDLAAARQVYGTYTRLQNPQGPDGLWLGIQLADQAGDANARASYEMALKNLYPQSPQYQTWLNWSRSGGRR